MKYLLAIVAAIGLTGCQDDDYSALEQWEGSEVIVQFRRDLLGGAGSPIAPTATWQNEVKLSLRGKITDASREGIFLNAQYKQNFSDTTVQEAVIWIPSTSILMVEKAK